MRKIDQSLKFFADNKDVSSFLSAAVIAGAVLGCSNGTETDHKTDDIVGMVQHTVNRVEPNNEKSSEPEAKTPNQRNIINVGEDEKVETVRDVNSRSPLGSENLEQKEMDGNDTKEGAFRFSTFKVPADGVLMDRNETGDDKESVIYILDYHDNSKVVSDYQRAVQMEIFDIVKDLVEKYEHVPLAMEVWQIGDTASNYRRMKTDSANIGRLFSTSTLGSRMALVPSLMRDTKIVGPVIVGTFRDSVEPIGTVSEEDQRKANELSRMGKKIMEVTSSKTSCYGTDGKTYSFNESKNAFRDGGSDVTDHCYCAVHEYEQEFVSRFSERLEEVPKKEVRFALGHDGNFSVVIAGYKHWGSAREELVSQGANYAAIAPRTLSPGLDEKLKKEHVWTTYPDSEDGRCDALRRENAQLLNTTLSHLKGNL